MILDRELCFLDKEALQNVESGVLGSAVDLGGSGQLDGRRAYVVIAAHDETTATGDPAMTFALEFAEDSAFTKNLTAVPLSVPPVKKADLAAGKVVRAAAPVCAKRYARLKLTTESKLTCLNVTAGIVLDS